MDRKCWTLTSAMSVFAGMNVCRAANVRLKVQSDDIAWITLCLSKVIGLQSWQKITREQLLRVIVRARFAIDVRSSDKQAAWHVISFYQQAYFFHMCLCLQFLYLKKKKLLDEIMEIVRVPNREPKSHVYTPYSCGCHANVPSKHSASGASGKYLLHPRFFQPCDSFRQGVDEMEWKKVF